MIQIVNTILETLDGTTNVEPSALLSYSDMQSHLKLDGTVEQTLVESLVSAATKLVENFIDRKIVTQHWSVYLDDFPRDKYAADWWDGARDGAVTALYSSGLPIELPFGPCQSVSFIRVYDQTEGTTTVDASTYQVDVIGPRPKIALRNGSSWPTTIPRPLNGIHVRAVFGIGSASQVPQDIKQAVKLTVANLYENRGDNAKASIPDAAQMLLTPYRHWKLR